MVEEGNHRCCILALFLLKCVPALETDVESSFVEWPHPVSLGELSGVPETLWAKHPLIGAVALNISLFFIYVNCLCPILLQAVINICRLWWFASFMSGFQAAHIECWKCSLFLWKFSCIKESDWFILVQTMVQRNLWQNVGDVGLQPEFPVSNWGTPWLE